ncbi:MAG: hypothetical protein KAQ75_07925 [Bacteroidales bacterium]|nr:hypothetical protein [Bacteroidales bacterium]
MIRRILPGNYRYYSRHYYYDKSFTMYYSIESLCKLFSIDKEKVETQTTLFLNKNINFGSNQHQIKNKLGSPSCYMSRSVNSLDFKIMYYRMYLGGYKTKQEVHLYENTLYYFNYIFSYLNSSDKEILKKLLCKKYLHEGCEIMDKVIIDKYGNLLFVTDNVDFTINYLTGDKSIPKEFKALNAVDEINRQKLIEQNQEELLNKL